MGLAASQSRLILLTARHSTLEYRGQIINQRRLDLSVQTDQIAEQYNNSLSNRRLYVTNADGSQSQINVMALVNGNYTDPNSGQVEQNSGAMGELIFDRNGDEIGWQSDNQGNVTIAQPGDPNYVSPAELEQGLRDGSFFLVDPTKMPVADPTNTSDPGNWWNLTGQDMIAATQAASVDWRTLPGINDQLYTDDDEEASAKYEYETDLIHTEDQQLELELKDIDTEHKAVETEIDAVKKVIDKNIEMSFKTFSA